MTTTTSTAYAIQSHLIKCTECQKKYEDLPEKAKSATESVFKLFFLRHMERQYEMENKLPTQQLLIKLKRAEKTVYEECKAFLANDLSKCHMVATCALRSTPSTHDALRAKF